MQQPGNAHEKITHYYATLGEAAGEIARIYFFQGRLSDARHFLHTSLQLLEAREAQPYQRFKLLFLSGQVLLVEHLLVRGDAGPLLALMSQVRQSTETIEDQQLLADAFSLLGQAHYFTTIVALLQSGASPDSPQSEGKYAEALEYQQKALELREALHDMRGMSESYFQIGVVYERWRQLEHAQTYYVRARQIADQQGYLFEKTEPARHMAIHALRQGNLEQARALALQAAELREAAGFMPYLPLDYLLVKDVYEMQGDKANAQMYLEKAAAVARKVGFPQLVASVPDRKVLLEASQNEF